MNIGIYGAGKIGGNLGRRWAAAGHHVRFGVRDVGKVKDLVAACGPNASAGDARSATAHGEVVVLALPWPAVPDVLASAGDLRGKILIDATNAVKMQDGPMPGPMPAIDVGSAAQRVAELAPGAIVVKAFNTTGAEHILHPVVEGKPVDFFLATDDDHARGVVKGLGEEIGFRGVDLGPLRNARLAEHLAAAWIWLAMKSGRGRNIAWRLMA